MQSDVPVRIAFLFVVSIGVIVTTFAIGMFVIGYVRNRRKR